MDEQTDAIQQAADAVSAAAPEVIPPLAWIADLIAGWFPDNPWLAFISGFGILLAFSVLVFLVVRRGILPVLTKLVDRTKTDWDDILLDARFLNWVAWVPVTGVVYFGVHAVPYLPDWATGLVENVAKSTTLLVCLLAVGALLTGVNAIYSRREIAKTRPIKGYIQIAKLIIYLIGGIAAVALLVDESPWKFVAGLGAMTAILLLIFKDTILSLVASVQLASNDMLRVGDWLQMDHVGANGDVIDISLHTVKVQNWDKTITTIPTHRLISESFINWRGMQDSGGRRIKRSFTIDLTTIRFLDDEELERYGKLRLLKDYIQTKREELAAWNAEHCQDGDITSNARRLTNIGTLRAYIINYLRSLPTIHQEGMTFMVRQLEAGEHGVPIQVYVFTKTTAWVEYEAIQSDLFDHLFAMVPELGLRVYQAPSGNDFARAFARRE